ncbi:MAG: Leu/Phe/Val dehydrogenase [Lachnospirales bacterium]
MEIFKALEQYGHEQLVFGQDEKTGLKAIVAVHSTAIGPAAGGTRFWNYEKEDDALFDVLRLSRGMTLKNAAADLDLGGGKAVILGDPKKLKSDEFFKAYGRLINSLGGKYYTAEDVNISTKDVDIINSVTPFVMGTSKISGNPSPFTARGVYKALKAGAKYKFGTDDLKGLTVAVQGLGSVGYSLAEYLHKEGVNLIVADINTERVAQAEKDLNAKSVSVEEIVFVECDVFAPCALGAILNPINVKQLKCKMVCGAANNVLLDAQTGVELEAREITYIPDYIANAGGIINCAPEATGIVYDEKQVIEKVDNIYNTTLKIIDLAKEKSITTYDAAEKYALDTIERKRK